MARHRPAATTVMLPVGWSGCVLIVLSLATVASSADTSESADARYFRGLRERGLYSLAESVCLRELDIEGLSTGRELELRLELSRTYSEHAQVTEGEEQNDLWSRAGAVLIKFLESHPGHPGRLRLSVQASSVPLIQGAFLARLIDLDPYARTRVTRALAALATGIARLKKLEPEIDKLLRHPAGAVDRASRIPAYELRVLLTNSRFRRAVAQLDRARLLPAGTPDRAAALVAAEAVLRQVSPRSLDRSSAVTRRLLQARVHRMRRDFDQARRVLGLVEQGDPTRRDADRVLAEAVWIDREAGRPDDAAERLSKRRLLRVPLSAELEFLSLAVRFDLWSVASAGSRTELADRLFDSLDKQAQRAGQVTDRYWAARVRRIHRLAIASRKLGPELARARDRASGLYRAGRTDEAVRAFAEAARLARESGRRKQAIEAEFTGASVLFDARRHDEAAPLFAAIAAQQPPHDRTARAHLLWAWCLGRRFKDKPDAARQAAYHQALTAHRKRFPTDPTALEATWLLARLAEHDGHYDEALALYAGVPVDHPRGSDSMLSQARCWEQLLERDGTRPRHREATTALGRLADTFPPPPKRWSRDQCDVATRLARLLLTGQPARFEDADRLLERVELSTPPDPERLPANWESLRGTARQLRVLSLAGRGQLERAQDLIERLAGDRPVELLAILDGLTRLAERLAPDARRALGELGLQLADRIARQRDTLAPADRRRLDRCRAQAYEAIGQPRRAVDLYLALLADSPRDAGLLTTLALARTRIGTPEELARALGDRRRIESLHRPGTTDWLEARLEVARALARLGRTAEAKKLLVVTRLLYPDRGGEALRAAFAALERKLGKR